MSTTNTPAPTPKAKRRRTLITPQMTTLRQLSNHWKALTGPQKNGWQTLSRLTAAADSAAPTKARALSTYLSVNSAFAAANASLLADAPPAPVAPFAFPPLLLDSLFDPATGAFTLTLTSPAAYPHPIVITAAKPMLAGQGVFKTTQFKRIGALPALSGPADLSALYQAHYHVPGDGCQILLRLIAVSETGLRSAPLQIACAVAAPAAAGLNHAPRDGDMHLQKTA